MDDGESLAQCAARELKEETGLVVDHLRLQPLALFESFFPTSPADCFARKKVGGQHLVCFFTVVIEGDRPNVVLQREEANAYSWVPGNAIELPPDEKVTVLARENGQMCEIQCPVIELTTQYNSFDKNATGLAQAHLFAIKQFTKQRQNKKSSSAL
jgi:ADP-ribose pyrophosphatase YjhB (NUDIX family)